METRDIPKSAGRSCARRGRSSLPRDEEDRVTRPRPLRGYPSLELDGPVGVVEEGFPALVFAMRELEAQGRARLGLDRLAEQLHAGLAGGTAPLADVALEAGADDVLPGRLPATAAGEDVVEAQLAGGEPLAAILAAVAVAGEDVPAVEFDLLAGE